MKEPTPIERLEYLGYDPKEIILDDDLFNEMVNKLVLEALEREFSKLDYVPVMDGEMAGINYYETEVKPNYE